jgi:hypothetical protein
MLGSFAVVPRGMREMFCCLFVMFCCFLGHMIFSVSDAYNVKGQSEHLVVARTDTAAAGTGALCV